MAYCEPGDLERYGVNAAALEGISPEERIKPAIAAAEAEINWYLERNDQYTLPLSPVPTDVKEATAILAAWRVLMVSGWKPGDDPEDSALAIEVKRIRKWLELLVDKNVPAPTETPPTAEESAVLATGLLQSNEPRGFSQMLRNGPYYPFQGRRQ